MYGQHAQSMQRHTQCGKDEWRKYPQVTVVIFAPVRVDARGRASRKCLASVSEAIDMAPLRRLHRLASDNVYFVPKFLQLFTYRQCGQTDYGTQEIPFNFCYGAERRHLTLVNES